MPLIETNPELVAAARAALQSVDPASPGWTRETIFNFGGKTWWTKMIFDPHANTIERWDILSVDDPGKW